MHTEYICTYRTDELGTLVQSLPLSVHDWLVTALPPLLLALLLTWKYVQVEATCFIEILVIVYKINGNF